MITSDYMIIQKGDLSNYRNDYKGLHRQRW